MCAVVQNVQLVHHLRHVGVPFMFHAATLQVEAANVLM